MLYAKLVEGAPGTEFFGGLWDVFTDTGEYIAGELTQRQVGSLAAQRGEQVEPHPSDIASGLVTRKTQ
jgi:hypothetical protein